MGDSFNTQKTKIKERVHESITTLKSNKENIDQDIKPSSYRNSP